MQNSCIFAMSVSLYNIKKMHTVQIDDLEISYTYTKAVAFGYDSEPCPASVEIHSITVDGMDVYAAIEQSQDEDFVTEIHHQLRNIEEKVLERH